MTKTDYLDRIAAREKIGRGTILACHYAADFLEGKQGKSDVVIWRVPVWEWLWYIKPMTNNIFAERGIDLDAHKPSEEIVYNGRRIIFVHYADRNQDWPRVPQILDDGECDAYLSRRGEYWRCR